MTAVVLSAASAEDRRVVYEYSDGRLTAVTSPGGISSTDAAGFTTRRSYNAANDPVSATDPLGRRSTFTYDSRGNLTTTSYEGRASSATYDQRGLPMSTRDVLGRTTRSGYSPDGDLTSTTDPVGTVTEG